MSIYQVCTAGYTRLYTYIILATERLGKKESALIRCTGTKSWTCILQPQQNMMCWGSLKHVYQVLCIVGIVAFYFWFIFLSEQRERPFKFVTFIHVYNMCVVQRLVGKCLPKEFQNIFSLVQYSFKKDIFKTLSRKMWQTVDIYGSWQSHPFIDIFLSILQQLITGGAKFLVTWYVLTNNK